MPGFHQVTFSIQPPSTGPSVRSNWRCDSPLIWRLVRRSRQAIACCAPHVSLLLPSETEFAERPAVASQAKDALDGLASLAARLGVVIADHALDAMQRTTRDGFGVGIDPALWVAAGRDPSAAVMNAAVHLAATRLVDSFRSGMRGPILEPGESRLDVTAYRVALDLIGFRSPLVVDARQWRDPLAGVETTIRRWAERWGYELPSPGSSSLGSILHGDPRPRH